MFFVDRQLYSNSKDGLLFLPAELVPQGKYRIEFGYTLLKDSVGYQNTKYEKWNYYVRA
jgi:hypothetical protein